jgi:DNA-binding NarL/FixJ family response regulator
VMLVDSRILVQEGLRAVIEREHDLAVAAQVPTVAEARRVEVRPDVIIAGIHASGSPHENGIAGLREFHRLSAILVLAPIDDRSTAQSALEFGANGYLLDTVDATVLVAAIRTVANGDTFVQHPSAAQPQPADQPHETTIELTPQEEHVLYLLALGHTNADVARQCGVSLRTAEARRAHLLHKLGCRTRAELVTYARETNLLDPHHGAFVL